MKRQKGSYTYDGNNNLIQEVYQDWSESDWVNIRKYISDYDENHNIIAWLSQGWDGSNWVDGWKGVYTYDENNKIKSLYQHWTGFK